MTKRTRQATGGVDDPLVIHPALDTTPRRERTCPKCSIILNTEQEVYQHQRSDSAGCIGALVSTVLHLNERVEIFEKAIANITAAGEAGEAAT